MQKGLVRRPKGILLQDPLHRRLSDVDTSPRQFVSDLHLSQSRAEELHLLDDVANEMREPIDRRVSIPWGQNTEPRRSLRKTQRSLNGSKGDFGRRCATEIWYPRPGSR